MVTQPVQQTSPTFVGMPKFPVAAREALANTQQRANLHNATHTIRAKRAAVVGEVEDWEALRVAGAAAKDEALHHLADYLVAAHILVSWKDATGSTVKERTKPEARAKIDDRVSITAVRVETAAAMMLSVTTRAIGAGARERSAAIAPSGFGSPGTAAAAARPRKTQSTV